jgi:hypothetical protein
VDVKKNLSLLKSIDLTNGQKKENPTSFSGWRGFEGSGGWIGFGVRFQAPKPLEIHP